MPWKSRVGVLNEQNSVADIIVFFSIIFPLAHSPQFRVSNAKDVSMLTRTLERNYDQHSVGTANPFTLVCDPEPRTASWPKPLFANPFQIAHWFAPPVKTRSAWRMASRACK